jgi:CO dehydrogenase/acetyl-CoA synthase gamma subunit (corrinoid Fe-S protein)
MRTVLISLVTLLCFASDIARAEQHRFLVANDADGYGVDRCLASGEKCGAAAANAYCRTQAFTAAAIYHKIDQDDLTGAVSKETAGTCQTGTCDVVAIVCLR